MVHVVTSKELYPSHQGVCCSVVTTKPAYNSYETQKVLCPCNDSSKSYMCNKLLVQSLACAQVQNTYVAKPVWLKLEQPGFLLWPYMVNFKVSTCLYISCITSSCHIGSSKCGKQLTRCVDYASGTSHVHM